MSSPGCRSAGYCVSPCASVFLPIPNGAFCFIDRRVCQRIRPHLIPRLEFPLPGLGESLQGMAARVDKRRFSKVVRPTPRHHTDNQKAQCTQESPSGWCHFGANDRCQYTTDPVFSLLVANASRGAAGALSRCHGGVTGHVDDKFLCLRVRACVCGRA